jgi:hypothetical protein
MTDCLRFLRVGIINILGITVPGLLLLVFLLIGFILPLIGIMIPFHEGILSSDQDALKETLSAFFKTNVVLLTVLGLIIAYVTGYIIRLSTPDDLDRRSAEMVLDKMGREAKLEKIEAAKKDWWPTLLDDGDKFPYFYFKEYLQERGHKDIADIVEWGAPDSKRSKRSKTHVNIMKLEVLTKLPGLSASIESNEAHVRLMFGTWLSISTCWYLVMIGCVVSFAGLLASTFLPQIGRLSFEDIPYAFLLLVGGILLITMYWAKSRIENLFHYQRVRELTHIVACVYFARRMNQKTCPDAESEESKEAC